LRSLLFFLGATLVFGVAGCGGEKKGETSAAAEQATESKSAAGQLPPADVTAKPGAEIATEAVTTALEGLFIKPYFDDAGTVAERSVAVGESFTIGVWAETAAPYRTNAAQFSMQLPLGVRVTSMIELEAKSISMGSYAESYQVAYDCQPSGRFWLVRYVCVADPEFQGGEVKVSDGISHQGNPYIGFSTCEDFSLAPSEGGSAVLKRK
jgi:hypothetical protein